MIWVIMARWRVLLVIGINNLFPKWKSSKVVVVGGIRSPVHDTCVGQQCCCVCCLVGFFHSWCSYGVKNRDDRLVNIRKKVVYG